MPDNADDEMVVVTAEEFQAISAIAEAIYNDDFDGEPPHPLAECDLETIEIYMGNGIAVLDAMDKLMGFGPDGRQLN